MGNSLNITVGISGHREGTGRNNVHSSYIMSLLSHKILVVAQRDNWEGHYRLMEALAGGAMVMTDPMHPLPFLIKDGESLVEYHTIKDLKEKILYYIRNPKERLKIAARGYFIAMNYHRSWHLM